MRVHLADCGTGNVFNVARALTKVGAEVVHCETGDELNDVSALVVPGVGAFGDCVRAVRERGFDAPINQLAADGCPVLGICVGMQMMADASEEFGTHAGLGLIAGKVKKIPLETAEGVPVKRTHIGWRQLDRPAHATWDAGPLANVTQREHFYFVHSYAFECTDAASVLATCNYRGITVTAAVHSGNLLGFQFHPEKSGPSGLALLSSFLDFADRANR